MAKKKEDALELFAGLNKTFEAKGITPVISSANDTLLGIAIPSLAFQYLLGTTALPLSRSFQIVGSEGSYKSTFMYELMRWYIDSGGFAVLIETESKDSGYIRNGIMKWDAERIKRIALQNTISAEQWMASVTFTFAHMQKQMQESGNYCPFIMCLDSITAVADEDTLEKISKEGHAASGYPTLARNLSAYAKKFTEFLSGFPYTFLFVNHYKPGMDASPYSTGVVPGGKSLSFANSITLLLSGDRGKASADGSLHANVIFKTRKNSNGPEGRSINVSLVRWSQADPNYEDEHIDYVAFDWAASDIQFLLKLMDDPKVGADLRREVKDLMGLHQVRVGTKNGVWSDALGIPKESPVVYTEAGLALQKNAELMKKLQNILLIRPLPIYSSDVNYQELLKKSGEERRERLQKLQDNIVVPSMDAEYTDNNNLENKE